MTCLVVVCGVFHRVTLVLPTPSFCYPYKTLSYKSPSGIAMEKPVTWVDVATICLHHPGSWADLGQQSSWQICVCSYSDALLLTSKKAVFSWRLPDCSIYFLQENVFSCGHHSRKWRKHRRTLRRLCFPPEQPLNFQSLNF